MNDKDGSERIENQFSGLSDFRKQEVHDVAV